MSRLFIAVDLPETATTELGRIQLPSASQLSAVRPDQMHLTLHFLGHGEIQSIADALREISATSFLLSIAGIGQFATGGDSGVLWAGVAENPELRRLHSAIGRVIFKLGFRLEERPFTPHITLARYKNGLSAGEMKAFLAKQAKFSVANVPITTFGLYSSTHVDHELVYCCEQSFPLSGSSPSSPTDE